MSKKVEAALIAVRDTIFQFINDGRAIEVRNAYIFWTNFRGEANKWGNTARTFNLAVTPEMAEILKQQGWRIREIECEEMGDILFFVNIKVNMNSQFPPTVNLYSEYKGKKSCRPLNEGSIGELDRVDIKTADCIISIYESDQFPGKLSGYLQKLNVIQEPNVEFGGKYDDWMDEEYDCLAAGTCTLEEYNAMRAAKLR